VNFTIGIIHEKEHRRRLNCLLIDIMEKIDYKVIILGKFGSAFDRCNNTIKINAAFEKL